MNKNRHIIGELQEFFANNDASKTHWKTCPKCQQRMKAEALCYSRNRLEPA